MDLKISSSKNFRRFQFFTRIQLKFYTKIGIMLCHQLSKPISKALLKIEAIHFISSKTLPRSLKAIVRMNTHVKINWEEAKKNLFNFCPWILLKALGWMHSTFLISLNNPPSEHNPQTTLSISVCWCHSNKSSPSVITIMFLQKCWHNSRPPPLVHYPSPIHSIKFFVRI